MTLLRLFKNTKPSEAGTFHEENEADFGEERWFKAILLLLGLGLGVLLAFFIVSGNWPFVFGLLLLIPAVILFSSYPYAALIIWMLVNIFLQTTPNSAYRMVFWIMHRGMPPVALGLVVLASLFKTTERRPVRLGRADLALLAFLGWAMVNILLFHPSPLQYLYWLYDRVVVPMCLYLLIRLVAPGEQDLKRLIPVAFFIVLVEFTVGLLSWLSPGVLPQDWLGTAAERTIGTLGAAHAYSTTLVAFSLLLFQAAMQHKSGPIRTVLLFTVGLGAAGVFLSFSRGGWLGGIVAALGLLVMYPKPIIRLTMILLIIMSILGASVFSKEIAFAQERMNSESTAKDRLVIWDAGLQMVALKPFFGWGYADYSLYAGQFQRRVYNYVATASHASHNSYIAIAVEMGVPALIIFALPLLWWLSLTLKVWPRLPKVGFGSRSLLVIFWLVILDHIVVNFFSDMRHSPYGMGMWWITLGLIANMVNTYLTSDDSKLPQWIRRAA